MKADRKDIHNSDIPAVCKSCEARHRGICGALSTDQLLHLSKYTNRTTYDSATELIPEGEDVERYSNILSGVIKLSKLLADGRQQIVGLQFAPDFLGRPFKNKSETTAETATQVEVCTFPKSILETMIHQSPELEHLLYEQSLKELDDARDWMMTLGRKTAAEKVASFLYLIGTHIDPTRGINDSSIGFEIPLKRADIADFLGLTIETVSRQLTKLRKAGTIELENNRSVTIKDMNVLRNACEQST
ncbi:MAG: Crp/Fnr family transcriptional regulator [Rhizobiaceae bacterium]|nr:Crp/Fnr family transcriptional regulator [Rhizobiaceae bacterium]